MYYKTLFNILISTFKKHQGYGGYPYSGCGCNNGYGNNGYGYGAAILLVLFILLVIVIGSRAFDNNNSCNR